MKLIIKVRRALGLFTIEEVISVVQTVGHAKDRSEFEWMLRKRLEGLRP